MLIGFGLDKQLREPVEVHCYYTTGFLITLRRAPSPALDALRQAGSVQPQLGSDPIRVLHEADDQELADFTAIEERCAALLVLHASLASKHLAVVSRRLADVATIFLPISFLAGFWGQNFDVLTGSLEKGWPAFLVLGVGLSAACVLVIVYVLSRRGWK